MTLIARSLAVMAVLTVLTACDAMRPAPDPIDYTPRCGADRLQGLVGQDLGAIRDIDLPEKLRIIRPGDAFTQDYRPDRLNIKVGDDGLITRVWCV